MLYVHPYVKVCIFEAGRRASLHEAGTTEGDVGEKQCASTIHRETRNTIENRNRDKLKLKLKL